MTPPSDEAVAARVLEAIGTAELDDENDYITTGDGYVLVDSRNRQVPMSFLRQLAAAVQRGAEEGETMPRQAANPADQPVWLRYPIATPPDPRAERETCEKCNGAGFVSHTRSKNRFGQPCSPFPVSRRCSCAAATPPDPRAEREAETRQRYEELLYAVAQKFPGESRHETALRYIRNAEASAFDAAPSGKKV